MDSDAPHDEFKVEIQTEDDKLDFWGLSGGISSKFDQRNFNLKRIPGLIELKKMYHGAAFGNCHKMCSSDKDEFTHTH